MDLFLIPTNNLYRVFDFMRHYELVCFGRVCKKANRYVKFYIDKLRNDNASILEKLQCGNYLGIYPDDLTILNGCYVLGRLSAMRLFMNVRDLTIIYSLFANNCYLNHKKSLTFVEAQIENDEFPDSEDYECPDCLNFGKKVLQIHENAGLLAQILKHNSEWWGFPECREHYFKSFYGIQLMYCFSRSFMFDDTRLFSFAADALCKNGLSKREIEELLTPEQEHEESLRFDQLRRSEPQIFARDHIVAKLIEDLKKNSQKIYKTINLKTTGCIYHKAAKRKTENIFRMIEVLINKWNCDDPSQYNKFKRKFYGTFVNSKKKCDVCKTGYYRLSKIGLIVPDNYTPEQVKKAHLESMEKSNKKRKRDPNEN